jgi:glycosyltransferase involved in cell wall biosynthesis
MKITIILPILNEVAYIERSLASIAAQDCMNGHHDHHLEVLIADGMSDDNTREIINDFAFQHSQFRIRVLDNPARIVPVGLNIALRQAQGDIIIRVDGHCVIAPDYVSKCMERIQKDGVDGVGGPMESIGENQTANAIAIGMSSPFGVGNAAFRIVSNKSMLADTVPFPAYTRQIIERAGLYDEELVRNQDDEYNYRIRKLGGKIFLAEEVHSTYFSRSTLKELWRQYYQYGYWKVRVLQKHPHQMSTRQFVPPLFVASLLFSALLLFFPQLPYHLSLLPFSLILGMYLLANLIASLWTAARRGWASLPLLPLIFAILHISYGAGFLVGLVKFWNRWGDKTGKVPGWSSETDG